MSYDEALGATLIERGIREKIVLVGVTIPRADDTEGRALDELELLVDTGADVVARLEQRRERPDPATFIGRGKAEELRELCLAVDADTVVFTNDLTPAQQYSLEKLLGRTAIERTAVILDIFAQNAHTLEGRAQVELALLQYRLPRLRRGAKVGCRSRVVGSAPARAPVRRSWRLIVAASPVGSLASSATWPTSSATGSSNAAAAAGGLANVTIVGYTNAGKSTLLNRLTAAGVLVETGSSPPSTRPRAASRSRVVSPSS